METAPAGVPVPFEYTAYDMASGLDVGMKIFDVTAGYPGTLVGTVGMVHTINGTYGASFTFAANKIYLINKMVYTDNTYATPIPTYSPGSESVQASTYQSDIQAILNLIVSVTGIPRIVGKVRTTAYLTGKVYSLTRIIGTAKKD